MSQTKLPIQITNEDLNTENIVLVDPKDMTQIKGHYVIGIHELLQNGNTEPIFFESPWIVLTGFVYPSPTTSFYVEENKRDFMNVSFIPNDASSQMFKKHFEQMNEFLASDETTNNIISMIYENKDTSAKDLTEHNITFAFENCLVKGIPDPSKRKDGVTYYENTKLTFNTYKKYDNKSQTDNQPANYTKIPRIKIIRICGAKGNRTEEDISDKIKSIDDVRKYVPYGSRARFVFTYERIIVKKIPTKVVMKGMPTKYAHSGSINKVIYMIKFFPPTTKKISVDSISFNRTNYDDISDDEEPEKTTTTTTTTSETPKTKKPKHKVVPENDEEHDDTVEETAPPPKPKKKAVVKDPEPEPEETTDEPDEEETPPPKSSKSKKKVVFKESEDEENEEDDVPVVSVKKTRKSKKN